MEQKKELTAATSGEEARFWEQILALSSSVDRVSAKANIAIAISVIAILVAISALS